MGILIIIIIIVFAAAAVVKIAKKKMMSSVISILLLLISAATLAWYLTPFSIILYSPRIQGTVNGVPGDVNINGYYSLEYPAGSWDTYILTEDQKEAFRNSFLETELRVRRPLWRGYSALPQGGYIQVMSYDFNLQRDELLITEWDIYKGGGRYDYRDPEYLKIGSQVTVPKKFLFWEYSATYLLIDEELDGKIQALLDA